MKKENNKNLWNIFKLEKKDFIEEANENFKKEPNITLITNNDFKFINEKEQINIAASKEAFLSIICIEKNHYNGNSIKDFVNFLSPSYADNEDIFSRTKAFKGDYLSLEIVVKRYWFRNLSRSIPVNNITTEKDFYKHLNHLRELPNFKTYYQHFWTLHSSNKAHPIYLELFNANRQNILNHLPLIKLNEIKIEDVNWLI